MYRYAHHHLCLASHLHHSSTLHLLHSKSHRSREHILLYHSTMWFHRSATSNLLLDLCLQNNNPLALRCEYTHHHTAHLCNQCDKNIYSNSDTPKHTHAQHTRHHVRTMSCVHAHRRRDTNFQSPHIDTLLPLECTHLSSQPKHNRLSRALCRLGM